MVQKNVLEGETDLPSPLRSLTKPDAAVACQSPQLEWGRSSPCAPPAPGQPGVLAAADRSTLLAGWGSYYLLQGLQKVLSSCCCGTVCWWGEQGPKTSLASLVASPQPSLRIPSTAHGQGKGRTGEEAGWMEQDRKRDNMSCDIMIWQYIINYYYWHVSKSWKIKGKNSCNATLWKIRC